MCSGLERPDTVPLPTTQHSRHKSVPVAHERHFPNVVEREAVADIEGRIAPVELRPSRVSREGIAGSEAIGSCATTMPRRSTVNGVAVGIVPSNL